MIDLHIKKIMKTTDFDIRGVVGVRLIDATEKDVRVVINQIGEPGATLTREPDITIRFVPDLPTQPLNLLALNAGYDASGFYILRSSKAPCKARIPFEKLGETSEIICQSGLRSVPLLIAMVNLALLSKNHLPLHASAFEFNGVCSAVMGWAKGGKTETMLAFAKHGGSYVADEWTVFSPTGEVFGIPEPIRLWDWHLAQIPRLRLQVKGKKKLIFGAIHGVDALYNGLCRIGLKKIFPVPIIGEALPAMKRQLNLRIHPNIIFENRLIERATPENIFLIGSHDSPETTVAPIDPAEIAERMLQSNLLEFAPLFEHYRAFRFAFPALENPLLESFESTLKSLLDNLFEGKSCYKVLHPYPVDFQELFEKMQPFCVPTEKKLSSATS